MITKEHLSIYQQYGGDGDMLIRLGSRNEREILNYENWKLIESFIQDIIIVKNGMAAKDFSESLHKKLKECCDGEETIYHLQKLALEFEHPKRSGIE